MEWDGTGLNEQVSGEQHTMSDGMERHGTRDGRGMKASLPGAHRYPAGRGKQVSHTGATRPYAKGTGKRLEVRRPPGRSHLTGGVPRPGGESAKHYGLVESFRFRPVATGS